MKATRSGKNRNYSGNNKAFAGLGKTVFFVCMLAVFVFFSHAGPLGAHESDSHDATITAGEVDVTSEESVKAFLLHVKAHWDEIPTGGVTPLISFKNDLSVDGDWRNGTTYTMRLGEGGALVHHPYYPLAQNGILDNDQTSVQDLIAAAEADTQGGCIPYTLDGVDRWSCAAKIEHPVYRGQTPPVEEILVVGLHHDFEDVSFANIRCPYYVPEISAIKVVDNDTMKAFVTEFADYYVTQVNRIGNVTQLRNCWRVLPWKYGAIYLFAMTDGGYVAFNGNTPSLEDGSLNVVDVNNEDVGEKIINAVEDLASGEGTFVEYYWDDPVTPDDDEEEGCMRQGKNCAPGTSFKRSYIERREITSGNVSYTLIFGSGVYPETEAADDGGCAVSRAGNKTQSTIFSLFLIVSILFSAALWKNRSKERKTMRKKERNGRNVLAGLFISALALLVFFSGASPAKAHEGSHDDSVTAGEVTVADQEKMMDFVLHAKAHWDAIEDPNENLSFQKNLTVEGGDWKNDTIYLITIDERGRVFTHAHDPLAQNGNLYDLEDADREKVVQKLISAAGMENCVEYSDAEQNQRWGCAVKFDHPIWNRELILIGGLHHNLDDVNFDDIQCPYFSEVRNEEPYFFQGTSANEVVDSDTLKQFVEQFVRHFSEQVGEVGQTHAQLARVRNCWRILPWKYENIYMFIMTEDQLVFFNGNTPTLENGTLDVRDDNGCDVGDEVVRIVNNQPRQCKNLGMLPEDSEGFIEYLWDDPTDDKPPVIEQGRAPGDVPKLSYVKKVSFQNFLHGENLIIGSGFHPEISDDAGCTIAGANSTTRSTLLNLLLIISVLFTAAFRKNRSSSLG